MNLLKIAAVLLIGVAFVGCAETKKPDWVDPLTETREKVNEHTDELDVVKEDVSTLKKDVKSLKADRDAERELVSSYDSIVIGGKRYHRDKGHYGPSKITESADTLIEADREIKRAREALGVPDEEDVLTEVRHVRDEVARLNKKFDAHHSEMHGRFDDQRDLAKTLLAQLKELKEKTVTVDDLETWSNETFETMSQLNGETLKKFLPIFEEAVDKKVQEMKAAGQKVKEVIYREKPTTTVIKNYPTYTYRTYDMRYDIPRLRLATWYDHHGWYHWQYYWGY